MSTATDERTLEHELRSVNTAIADLERQADVAHAEAEKVVDAERAAGRDPVKDTASFDTVDAAYKVSDDLREQAAEKRREAGRIMRIMGRDDQAVERGRAPVASAVQAIRRFTETPEYQRLKATDGFTGHGARVEIPGVEAVSRAQLREAFRTGAPLFTATADVDALIASDRRLFPPVPIPIRQVRILDLITMATTDSDAVDYVIETLRDDVAAETALGTAYPEASYAYDPATANVRDIGHFTAAHRSNLADEGQLQGLLEGRLESGVQLRFESQIVNGNGIGQNLTGILNTDGIGHVDRDSTAAEKRLETIHRGITAVRLTLFQEPDAIGLHPSNYEQLVFEKGSDGQYLLGPASQATARTVWGFPAAITSVFPENTGLVGNYKAGAVAWLRSGVTVRASDSHEDFFTKRMVALLAELRSAFAAWQPVAFCEVDFS